MSQGTTRGLIDTDDACVSESTCSLGGMSGFGGQGGTCRLQSPMGGGSGKACSQESV